jgi:F0F1-type ATP synthase assembly protein I
MRGKGPNSHDLGHYFALAQVGLEMVVPIVVGLLLDNWLDWRPWGVVAGAVFGLVGGLAHLVQMLNRMEKKDKTDRRDSQ